MIPETFRADDPAWLRFMANERDRFVDAVTSDADEAVRLFDQLYESLTDAHVRRSAAERREQEWRVRFKDRDSYAALLEAELRPRRIAEVELGVQEAIL